MFPSQLLDIKNQIITNGLHGVKDKLLDYHQNNNLESRLIMRSDDIPYLTRYYLYRKTMPWQPSLYLHCFHASDEDVELHSHPWNQSYSLILSGSYQEEYLNNGVVKKRILKPGMVNCISHDKFHRVDLLTPEVWTLFLSGSKTTTWGFLDTKTNKFTGHEEYIFKREMSKDE